MDNIELHINEKYRAETEVIDVGTLIEYLFEDIWEKARVSQVHYDDVPPYYSILLEKDNVIIERKTIRQKIRCPQNGSGSKLPQLFRRGSMPFKRRSSEPRVPSSRVMPYQCN
jgi:hypothetical protein|tara:strand:+ start:187 stop:525 length:339 start_codon:yes stop_codon:yes gene_type:complete